MSLNVKTIRVGETEITLRLTSKALLNFNLKHGIEGNSPVVAVLNTVSDYAARIDLFTNALQHPENKNAVKTGDTLLDMMADDPTWDRDGVNLLILELAEESGLILAEEVSSLVDPVVENGNKLVSTLAKLLAGESVSTESQEKAPADSAENPT